MVNLFFEFFVFVELCVLFFEWIVVLDGVMGLMV